MTGDALKATVDLAGALTGDAVADVAAGTAAPELGADGRARMAASSAWLDRHIADGRRIYGVTTGFGPLARYHVGQAQSAALQEKLLDHLATGVGPLLDRRRARAVMAARAASLARGWSGVPPAVAEHLCAMLARDVVPAIPEAGTVGASGDLTPLAHLGLAAIGKGEVLDGAGGRYPAEAALRAAGMAPLPVGPKVGLAMVNGTAAMTGLAACNGRDARAALTLAGHMTVAYGELFGFAADGLLPGLARARPHSGQARARRWLAALAADSRRLAAAAPQPPAGAAGDDGVTDRGTAHQPPYSFRCAPQELGAGLAVLAWHDGIVATELQSATDNPLIDPDTGDVLHGGNFYGQDVAYAADALADMAVKQAAASEVRLARLCDPARGTGLPSFLTGGTQGLDSGLMGAQVTASARLAEMRTKAVPAAGQSLATNNANQDTVTLGSLAARNARDQLGWLWDILAIEAMAVAQAVDLSGGPASGFATATRDLHGAVRTMSPRLDADRPLSGEIPALAQALASWAAVRAGATEDDGPASPETGADNN